jgi:uncharacterized protein YkwD
MHRGIALVTLLASIAAGLLVGSPPAAAAGTDASREHVRAVNDLRQEAGLRTLRSCAALDRAAAAHAEAMAASKVFSHTGPDGSTPGQRARSSGYRSSAVGENLAVGYPDLPQVLAAWLESPGHRANLLDPRHRHIGVASVPSADGIYWVQVFGQARRR